MSKHHNTFDLGFRAQITDQNRRKKYGAKELKTLVLKSLLEFPDLSIDNKYEIGNQLQTLKQGNITRIRNRCVLTGRSSTLKRFRLSRICFREQAMAGKLVGISKRLNK